MSVTVRHLNGDTSFLLIFSPETNPTPNDLRSASGAYSVLIDPWIVGGSVTAASWFAVTHRIEPSAISHLSELVDEPDVVICSQNKQDHTNRDTLVQLRPKAKTIVVAEPAAAKEIRSWKHFDPNRVHAMAKYNPKAKFSNVLRLHLAPLSPEGEAGEVSIAFIPAKNYVTGLHNAFGITYRPPTKTKTLAAVPTVDLPTVNYIHTPASPGMLPESPWLPRSTSDDSTSDPGEHQPPLFIHSSRSSAQYRHDLSPQLTRESCTTGSDIGSGADRDWYYDSSKTCRNTEAMCDTPQLPYFDFEFGTSSPSLVPPQALPTPPASPEIREGAKSPMRNFSHKTSSSSSMVSRAASTSNLSATLSGSATLHAARPKALSVLYTPHGIPLADLKPYVQNHLVSVPGALPLTLLLHSFGSAENPWWLGGSVLNGAEHGMNIAKALMAKCWISAHDEEKDNRGVAVKLLRTRQIAAEEINQALHASQDGRPGRWACDVRSLESGEELLLVSADGSKSTLTSIAAKPQMAALNGSPPNSWITCNG